MGGKILAVFVSVREFERLSGLRRSAQLLESFQGKGLRVFWQGKRSRLGCQDASMSRGPRNRTLNGSAAVPTLSKAG